LKNLQKTHAKKVIAENVAEKLSIFTFITVCKSFRPSTYLWVIFCASFNGDELSIKFCVLSNFWEKLFLLLLAPFANFKAKIG
jgi:hypothetical protein